MKVGGQILWNVTPMCETSQICCLMGRCHMRDVLVNHFKWPIIPFVHWLSIKESINLERKLGYALYVARIWKGDVLVADLEELETMDASEIYSKRLNAKEVISPKKKENLFFEPQMDESKPLEEIRNWEHPPWYGTDQFKERVILTSWTLRRVSSTILRAVLGTPMALTSSQVLSSLALSAGGLELAMAHRVPHRCLLGELLHSEDEEKAPCNRRNEDPRIGTRSRTILPDSGELSARIGCCWGGGALLDRVVGNPVVDEESEPNQPKVGWQQKGKQTNRAQVHPRRSLVRVGRPLHRALFHSQHGPLGYRHHPNWPLLPSPSWRWTFFFLIFSSFFNDISSQNSQVGQSKKSVFLWKRRRPNADDTFTEKRLTPAFRVSTGLHVEHRRVWGLGCFRCFRCF